MYVIGAQALLAWNAPVATEALTLFQNTVASQLNAADGYVVGGPRCIEFWVVSYLEHMYVLFSNMSLSY